MLHCTFWKSHCGHCVELLREPGGCRQKQRTRKRQGGGGMNEAVAMEEDSGNALKLQLT